ncbi:MAG: histidine kinase [Rectinema sp.]
MRIRTRFLAVLMVELIGFTALAGFSMSTFARIRSMRNVVENGMALVSRSRRVYSLLKDVVFDLFTPASYRSLRSVVLAPRSLTTGRELSHETGLFHDEYSAFMNDPLIPGLLNDPELKEAYETAAPLADQAFTKFEDLSLLIERLRTVYPNESEDLYILIQESKDESLYAVFGEIRDSSFYLNNIFESFLNRFVRGIGEQADRLERIAVFTLGAAVLLLGGITVFLLYGLSSSTLKSIRTLDVAIGKVAEGDFSVRVPSTSKDELGNLAVAFEKLAGDLKRNVESIPSVLKDVNEALPDDPDMVTILAILTEALLREGGAQSVSMFIRKREGLDFAACSGFSPVEGWIPGEFRQTDFISEVRKGNSIFLVKDAVAEGFDPVSAGFAPGLSSLLVATLLAGRKKAGYCVFARRDRGFTDLEVSRLNASADYAAQVIDNVAANAALAAGKDAEFQALQAQIQPHFLYNVLTSIMALNRMGESRRLEEAVIALKEMLHYTLEHGTEATVAEEFKFLQQYCGLQKLRHGERFAFLFDVEDAVLECRIPKLIVQPVVENALIHGLEPKRGKGRLKVSAALSGGELRIEVEDNGVGCDPSTLEGSGPTAKAAAARVGLGNVRRRLELLKRDARLELSGSPGKGFLAVIFLPVEEDIPS